MNVTIYGTGYVGLVTGACLAEVGHNVLCVDVDAEKIAMIERGEMPIYEPGLKPIVMTNMIDGRLRFTTHAEAGVKFAEVQMIAVGTPPGEDGSADLIYVQQVAKTIADNMTMDKVVVVKSTVPVGSCDSVEAIIHQALFEKGSQLNVNVVSNPEFLKEGCAVDDFMQPDRIIVGLSSSKAAILMLELYKPFGSDKVIMMDVRSSELTKYAANAMLATRISFMNEIANIAERLGADVEHVKVGIGADPRIGDKFLNPGCGYGGSCFPKDVKALISMAKQSGYDAHVINATERTNDAQKGMLFGKLKGLLGDVQGKIVAVWGLAFKPGTDDMREAPSLTLIEALLEAGAVVSAYDPKAMIHMSRVAVFADKYTAAQGADAIVICTEWDDFKRADTDKLGKLMANRVMVDGRNIFEPHDMISAGWLYDCFGR